MLQSKEFWQFAAPLFHEAFPFTAEAPAADFYKTYNRVSPGCIRVEADEVTYISLYLPTSPYIGVALTLALALPLPLTRSPTRCTSSFATTSSAGS